MDNLSRERKAFLSKMFPELGCKGDILKNVCDEKSFHSFIDEQFRIEETLQTNRKGSSKKVIADSDSDDDLKQQLKNAVEQYKNNRKQEHTERDVFTNASMSDTTSKVCSRANKTKGRSTQAKVSAEQHKNLRPIENLLGESETNLNCEIGSNGSAFSDVKQLINFFFLKKTEEVENIKFKKLKEYEKQGAIPKCLFRENLNALQSGISFSRDIPKSEHFNSKAKLNDRGTLNIQNVVSSGHGCSKNETQSCKADFSERSSDDSIVKLGEGTCSRPFFYIVPENPSPNFLFPRGSYYVIPKSPDSESGHSIIVHPETTSHYKINIDEDFEIKTSQSSSTEGTRKMNDLGKVVAQKSDSHLNIGPEDVKLNEFCKNLEGNNETKKSYEKTSERPDNWPNDDASCSLEFIRMGVHSKEGNRMFETVKGDAGEVEGVSVSEAASATQEESAVYLSEHSKFSYPFEQVSESEFANVINTTYLEGEFLQRSDISEHQNEEKKIEEQFLRMLEALPESNIQELRELCELFRGNEEQVDRYIEEVQRKNRVRQRLLDMQFIFPDADPDYLSEEIETLGDNDDAINILTDRLLDNKDYPKVLAAHIDAERQRLWRIYVDKFEVSDYIRNVPNPQLFGAVADSDKSEKYSKLDLEFLQSIYPDLTEFQLRSAYVSVNKNLTKTCTALDSIYGKPLRLACSTFKTKEFDEAFLKEVCYTDNKKEIDEYLNNLKALKEAEVEEARLNNTFLYCPLCCNDELITSEAVTCADGDLFCKDCVKRYVFVKLGDGVYKFSCPSDTCEAFFTYATLEKLLPDTVLSNIIKKQQAAEISTAKVDGLESCPFCEYAYIPNPEDKIFKCQNLECLTESCRKCHEVNHIPLNCEEIERAQDLEARKKIEESMTEKLVRICPSCFKKFVKIDGCNKMVCTCGTMVCYYCRRKVTGYEHFSQYPNSGKCPLYSDNAELHVAQVIRAGVEERNRILEENPNLRILHDPTTTL